MKKFLLIFAIVYSSLLSQINIQSRLELEIFITVKNIEYLNGSGVFFQLLSLQSYVYENERNRYEFIYSNNSNLLRSTFPYNAPGLYNENLIFSNSSFPNNRKWGGFDFISG